MYNTDTVAEIVQNMLTITYSEPVHVYYNNKTYCITHDSSTVRVVVEIDSNPVFAIQQPRTKAGVKALSDVVKSMSFFA